MAAVDARVEREIPSTQARIEEAAGNAYQKFQDMLEKTKAEVKDMQGKLVDYDSQLRQQASTSTKQASDYFKASLEEVKSSLDELALKAKAAFEANKSSFVEFINNSGILKSFIDAVEKLRSLAVEFDAKYGSKLKSKATETFGPLFARLSVMASTGKTMAVKGLAGLETKYNIEQRLQGIDEKYKITEKAKQAAKRGEDFVKEHKLKEKLIDVDERVTAGKAAVLVEQGMDLVVDAWGKIHAEYEAAKKGEASAPPPAAPKKAN